MKEFKENYCVPITVTLTTLHDDTKTIPRLRSERRLFLQIGVQGTNYEGF